jgi:hypothetical protein
MRRYMHIIVICVVCLLLISISGASAFGETRLKDESIEIKNNDYWVNEMKGPEGEDEALEYTIRINTSGDTPFDIYIMDDEEVGKYKDNERFKPELKKENITDSGKFTFEVPGGIEMVYIVVDNRDNINTNDAYANTTITVHVKIERYDDSAFWMALCFAIPIIGIIALVAIIIWIIVARNRPQRPYEPWLPIKNPPIRK